MATLPTRILEIEFDTGVWTDVTADMVVVGTRRGRNRELGAFETGTMFFTLRNDTRKYDPDNSAGPYYGKLRPNRRVRFRATYSLTFPIFQGYLDRITQVYGGPNDAAADFECSDLFKILNRVELPSSVYTAEVKADAPKLWWRLGEPAGSTTAADSSGNNYSGTLTGGAAFGASGLIVRDPSAALALTETGPTNVGGAGPTVTGTTPWALEFWLRLAANPTVIQVVAAASDGQFTGANNYLILQINNVSKILNVLVANTAGTFYQANFPALNASQTYHVVITHNSDRVLRGYLDGALAVTGDTTTGTISWNTWYVGSPHSQGATNGTVDEYAVYSGGATTALSTTRMGVHNSAGRTPWNGDTTGARLVRILDLAGVPTGDRAIDAGSTTLQATDLGGTALGYAQKVEATEAGRLFVSADGKVTFMSRANAVTGTYLTSQATLVDADSGAGRGYRSSSHDVDEGAIVTRATVSREGSVAYTYTDAAAVAEFQIIDQTLDGLLHDSDTYSQAYAEWLVNTQKTPITRVGAVALELTADPALMYPDIFGLEIGDRVTYKKKPQNLGAVFTLDMRVEAIAHETGAHYWRTTLQLSPFNLAASGYPVGVWDTSLWDQAVWGF